MGIDKGNKTFEIKLMNFFVVKINSVSLIINGFLSGRKLSLKI